MNIRSSYCLALVFSCVMIALNFGGFDNALAYQRSAIEHGEWWRIFSGNLLHTNHWHLLMNLGGLWLIMMLHHFHYSSKNLLVILILLAGFQGLGLYLIYPDLLGYVGLSGVLHGLISYGAIKDIQLGMKSGYLLLIGVVLKVASEQVYGSSTELIQLIEANVATQAHLIGLVSGLIIVSISLLSHHLAGAAKQDVNLNP